MPDKTLTEPSISEAADLIDECIQFGSVITIAGRCEVDYDGRTSSFLPPGDRLIVRKPDGTLLIHQDEKRKPVNWQPPGASFSVVDVKEDPSPLLLLHSEQSSPDETIDIRLEDVYMINSFEMLDSHEIEKVGTEEHIQDHIIDNPDVVEDGLRQLEKEKDSDVGRIDVFAKDRDGRAVIIEVKRRRGQPKHVDQLERYVTNYRDKTDGSPVRGILVAPSATDTTHEMLDTKGFELVNPPENLFSKDKEQNFQSLVDSYSETYVSVCSVSVFSSLRDTISSDFSLASPIVCPPQ
jgi:Predicted nuclease of the RecB family